MAPEGQGAQVLPDPDLGLKKVTLSTKSGVPCNFCFIKFLPKRTVEAPEAPHTPFSYPGGWGYSGVGVPGQPPPPKNLPTLEDHLRAKFHLNPSSRLDFYREHTHTQSPLSYRLA